MHYELIVGVIALIIGAGFMRFAYDKSGEKKERYFFCAVLANIMIHVFLIYEYIVLRGDFVVHDCIYAVTGALLLGAAVLWASRMLFSFAHEGFRVLLGVAAVIAGCFGGCGIDMIIAYEAGTSSLSTYNSAFALCVGAISITLSDIAIMIKNFSVKDIKIMNVVFDITSLVGIVMIFYGAVIA